MRATAVQPALGFTSSFIKAGVLGSDTINPGDTLTLTIWENVDDGLLASMGSSNTALTELQVDSAQRQIEAQMQAQMDAQAAAPDKSDH